MLRPPGGWSPALVLGLAACLLAASPGAAHATSVTYSTSGTFTAGTDATVNGNTITITDPTNSNRIVTVTFTPQAAATVNTTAVGTVGTFTVNAAAVTGSNLDIPTSPTASTFDLTINQTVPTAGSTTLHSTLAGSVSINSGQVEVQWTTTSASIGAITYTLANLNTPGFPPNTLLLPTTVTGGVTVASAVITGPASASPEPSTMALALTGLVAGGLAWVRKRRTRTAR